MYKLQCLNDYLQNNEYKQKHYFEFDDDINYIIQNNTNKEKKVNNTIVYFPYNVDAQLKYYNNDGNRIEEYKKINKLIGQKFIKTKYDGSNKLFKLLQINNHQIIFLINSHIKEIKYNNGSKYISHINCAIPPCIMCLQLTKPALWLFEHSKTNEGGDVFLPWRYGNVYNTGIVCIGTVKAASLLNYKNYIYYDEKTNSKVINIDLMLHMCYLTFFDSPFNKDLSTLDIKILQVKN